MGDLFATKKRDMIVATVRLNIFLISPEDKELTDESTLLPWFNMTPFNQDKAHDKTP